MKENFLRIIFLAKLKGLPLKHFCFGDMTFYSMNGKNGLAVRVFLASPSLLYLTFYCLQNILNSQKGCSKHAQCAF
jgi:hypothetical protein